MHLNTSSRSLSCLESIMTAKIPLEDQFSNELLCAIGKMLIIFASAENALAIQVARLISHPESLESTTALAISGTQSSVLIQQIQILSRFHAQPKQRPAILKKCDQIRKGFDLRNDLAHCSAGRGPDKNKIKIQPFKMKANGQLVPQKIFTTTQINEATDKFNAHLLELDKLLTDAGVTPIPKSAGQGSQQPQEKPSH